MKKLVKKASENKVRMVSLYANEGGTNKPVLWLLMKIS